MDISSLKINNSNSGVFTENKGQVHDQFYESRKDVLFSGEAKGINFHLKKEGVSYQISKVKSWKIQNDLLSKNMHDSQSIPDSIEVYRIDINWIGINTDYKIEQGEVSPDHRNFYFPSCPDGALNVRSFKNITYKEIYNGIDLKWYSRNGTLEYDFIIQPYIDYKMIRWEIEGATDIFINETGQLVIKTPLGEIIENAPVAYQESRKISTYWSLDANVVSFVVNEYDNLKPLIIDPMVRHWGTYYGGNGLEHGWDCVVDNNTDIITTGGTRSSSFIATTGSHQTVFAGFQDAFVAKFDSSGTRLWSTYFGGTADDYGTSCDVDGNLNIYVTGSTGSSTSISTTGSFQSSHGGGAYDGFLAKFNSSGVRQWATYYGGSTADNSHSCAVYDSLSIYIVGGTASTSSISTTNGFQNTYGGGVADCFLVKFDQNGNRIWASYYGGTDLDVGLECVVNIDENIFITGKTRSATSIATSGSHQSSRASVGIDAFLVKFDSSGTRIWGTYYGGTLIDNGISCAADALGNIYITGNTSSATGISTVGAHQFYLNGGSINAFLVKFDSSGLRQWGTYYGNGYDYGEHIAIDNQNDIYMSGYTASYFKISTPGSYQELLNGSIDAFLVKFKPNGERYWGTYYGGENWDGSYSCATDVENNVYLYGNAESTSYISSSGSHQDSIKGTRDAFLVKFNSFTCFDDSSSITVVSCDSFMSPSKKHVWMYSGIYKDTIPNSFACDSIITIDLTITTINTSVAANKSTLTSNALSAHYQWVDCMDNFSPIPGDTNSSFTATKNGSYAVIINKNGCIDTSDCFEITGIGIVGIEPNSLLHVYPNPTSGELIIKMDETHDKVSVSISDINGKLVTFNEYKSVNLIKTGIEGVQGIYLIDVQVDRGEVARIKVLKE